MLKLVLKISRNQRSAALVTVLTILLLVSMIATSSIYVMTHQSRLVERQIRRIRAFYSAQAATVQAIDELSHAQPLTNTLSINDQAVAINYDPATGTLNSFVDYSF